MSQTQTQTRPGADAARPTEVPARGWKQVALRVKDELKRDNVPLLGAGVAFYAIIAIVPALVAFMSIYGLFATPADAEQHVTELLAAAPSEVRELVREQLTNVVSEDDAGLGISAAIGFLIAIWSASSGMKHLISAINSAYDEEETRKFFALRGTAVLLTIAGVIGLAIAIGVITVLPRMLEDSGLGGAGQLAVSILRWPLLGLGLLVALAVLYRYAPDRDNPRWAWVAPGSVAAVIGWLVASILFSVYTSNFGSYGETYGSLGAVVVLMLWLMISATMIVIGAELNAEAEHQTAEDSTEGRPQPRGSRGAYVADTMPGDN